MRVALATTVGMKHPRARVYFRSYLPDEMHPPPPPSAAEVDERWRDETSMDFAHDRHSKWEILSVPEATEAAVQAALEQAHPQRFVIVDKISWIEESVPS